MKRQIKGKVFALFAIATMFVPVFSAMAQEGDSFSARIGVVRNIMSAVQSSPGISKEEKEKAWDQYVAIEEKNEELSESVEKADLEYDQFMEKGNKEWEDKQAELLKEAERINGLVQDHNLRHREFGPGEDAELKAYNDEADRLNKMRDDFIARGEREEQQLGLRLDREQQQFDQKRQQRMQQFQDWANGNSSDAPNGFVMTWGSRIRLDGDAITQLRILNSNSQDALESDDLNNIYAILRDSFENGRGHYDANVVDLRDLDNGANVIFPKRKK